MSEEAVRDLSPEAGAPGAGLLHLTFEVQARRTPDATALVAVGSLAAAAADAADSGLTYATLEARANALAHHLQKLGVGPEVRVGICLERGAPLVVCMLAVLKAGGAYVPLDPTYPPERLALLLEDSDAAVLITQQTLLALLPASRAEVVLWESLASLDPREPSAPSVPAAAPPPCRAAAGNLAYLIYTSGSSGRPKAVAVSHASAAAFVAWALTAFSAAELAGVLAATSVCFDLSIFEIFVPLAAGGAILLARNALDLPAPSSGAGTAPGGVAMTLINTVPSALREMLRQGTVPPSVRVVNLAGEALPGVLVEAAYEATAVDKVFNLYGPSEDTTYSTYALITREQAAAGEPSIGSPLPGSWAWLIDREGRRIPAEESEEVGELLLGGVGLARGYLRRPDLTAERFLPDPFAAQPGARVYRTGDLARWLPGGELRFLGRADSQVKVRGFRIELGEVEAVLSRDPALREAAVTVGDDRAGGTMLIAYVSSKGEAPSGRELRERLLEKLPAHMVPSVFVHLEALPRTPNGKIDRRALPEPGAAAGDLAAVFVAPRTPTESRLAELWGELLGFARLGVDDHFFALGGHSLLATRLLAKVRDAFGVELTMQALFAAPTIAGLGAAIDAAAAAGSATPAHRMERLPRGGRHPLSDSQLGVWFADRVAGEVAVFNIAIAVSLRGPLDRRRLAAALAALVRRHAALRTCFPDLDGEVWQEELPAPAAFLPLCDLAGAGAGGGAELDRLQRAEARRRFDLRRGPLLRTTLVRLGPDEHRLLFTVHHVVFDGWSTGLFWRELSALYADPHAELPELPIAFADFAAWQRGQQGSPRLEEQAAWWRGQLAGLAPLELPLDRPRPAVRSFRGALRPWRLPEELAGGLRDLARRRGATSFMAIGAAYAALLARYSGQDDLAVGVPSAGRLRSEVEGLIGLFVNELALRVDLRASGTPGEPPARPAIDMAPGLGALVERLRAAALDAFAHQELPFDRVVGDVNPQRDPSRGLLFQASYQVVDEIDPAPVLPGLETAAEWVHNGSSKSDVDLELEDRGGAIRGRCEFAVDLFDAATVERFLGHLTQLVAAGLAEPSRPYSSLPLLGAAERQNLLAWSAGPAPDMDDADVADDADGDATTLHGLVWSQARRRPSAPAVWSAEESVTYGELAARARRLADRLRGEGIGLDAVVGISADSSPGLVIAMLGVLTAGAAFLPLDPELPAERRAFMLADAGAVALIASPAELRLLRPSLPPTAASTFEVGEASLAGRRLPGPAGLAAGEPAAGSLAYVLYTSGTTGRPKGVAVPHRAVVNRMLRVRELFAFGPDDAMPHKASIGFDVAVSEIFLPLVSGGRAVLTAAGSRRDPAYLARLFDAQDVTFGDFVPQALDVFLDQPGVARSASRLRQVFVGGDVLPAALRDRFAAAFGFTPSNGYGPTEAAIDVTWHAGGPLPAGEMGAVGPALPTPGGVPIGRPLAGCDAYVVERALELAPVGVPGELWVGGACLARGYLGMPALTAAAFVPDPFTAGPKGEGARLYRTGDRCRWLPDGELEFLGRLDSQVKIRGVRVEPAEVEAVLRRSPAVRDAAVVTRREGGIHVLMACVVPAAEAAPDAAALRTFLKAGMPEQMVPRDFVFLDALPVTVNGKVDRRALALLAPAAAGESGDPGNRRPPATPVERVVAAVFADVVGRPVESIAADDHFFDIGGHSLLAARLMPRLHAALGVDLAVRQLFETPVVSELAAVVEERLRAAIHAAPPQAADSPRAPIPEIVAGLWDDVLGLQGSPAPAEQDFFAAGGTPPLAAELRRRIRDGLGVEVPAATLRELPRELLAAMVVAARGDARPVAVPPLRPAVRQAGSLAPLSLPQQRLWFLARLAPDSVAYNLPAAYELRGRLDAAALAWALARVVRRHEALRTTFVEIGGQAWQRVEAPRPVPLPVIDLGALTADAPALLAGIAAAEAGRPFDLGRGPLLRAALVRRAGDEHVLLLDVHHIVYDGWSEQVLLDELAALYGAALERRTGAAAGADAAEGPGAAMPPGGLAELPVQYADFAVWQRGWPAAVLEGQLAYWTRQLAGAPTILDLATDRPRPAVQSFRGGTRTLRLAPDLAARLSQAARRQGATLHMQLVAAFGAVLSLYSGQDDLLIGTPVANRATPEVEGLIGFFVNTLVLRARLDAAAGFDGLVTAARETTLAAFAHQDLPFETLVEELRPERDLARTPLVQVILALARAPEAASGPPQDAASRPLYPLLPIPIELAAQATAKFDLSLAVEESAEGVLTVELEYAADLFHAATALRLLEHFTRWLEGAVAEPRLPWRRLSLLSAAERYQVLRGWNDTRRQAAEPAANLGAEPIHRRVVEHARRAPAALAVTAPAEGKDAGRQLTYGELELRSRRLAHTLRRLGVGPEVRVGVCLERSLDLVVAVLAVMRAGGAYVALDPSHPAERLAYQLRDSRAPVVVARRGAAADLAAAAGIVCLVPGDSTATGWGGPGAPDAAGNEPLPAAELAPENLAYVIYTSGSTGRPKGVELTHGGLCNLVDWHLRAFGVTAADRAPLAAGVGFDASVWEIWPYLASGASLHVVPEAVRTLAPELRDWLLAERISLGFLPVALAEPLLGLDWPAPDDGGGQVALRWLLTGADRLQLRPAEGAPFAVVNAYGPTENTVVATTGDVAAVARFAAPPPAPTIGRPIDDVRAYVAGRWASSAGMEGLAGVEGAAAPGVPGELLIGGASLARGYLGRPDLTAERFVPDAFSGAAGGRLYRTGDLVRWLADGEIEFLGRIDSQVKIRGYRIEPGEIEAALLQHPALRQAAVLPADGNLVAFVACRAGMAAAAGELRDHLRRQMPAYMIPAAFVVLDGLPLNASGKVDRRALARLDWRQAAGGEGGTPAGGTTRSMQSPVAAIEELIAGIWAEVLGRSVIGGVGAGDNFFDLGGHSLLVTRVVSRLRETLGVELPVQALFAHPTVAELARAAAAARQSRDLDADGAQLPPLVAVPRAAGERLPLSFPQQRLWFLDRLAPDSPTYNIPAAWELRGALSPAALAWSLGEVVRRHEALRTSFVEVDGEPWQQIQASRAVALPVIDLRHAGAAERELARLMRDEAERPFDLTRGPLLRATLVRLEGARQDRHVLLLTVHHIVSDGWSDGLLREEIAAAYAAATAGGAGLPALPVQYADFSLWQRAWPPAVLAGQLAYWRRQLDGAPLVLELPADRPRPPAQSFRGAERELLLPPRLAARLHLAARREGVTFYMLLLAGFATLLSRYTGERDLLVGTPVANRSHSALERLIGFFVNTLALRVRLAGEPSFRALLAAVRDTALDGFAHQDLPFEAVVEELQPARDMARNPVVQVLLALQSAGAALAPTAPGTPAAGDGALRLLPLPAAAGATAKFDLSLTVVEGGPDAALTLAAEYATDLFTAATVTRLLGHYGALLAAVAEDAGGRISALPLLAAAERQQLQVEWNDTGSAWLRRTLHELFAAQAAARPRAVALVWEDGELTYGELDRLGDRVARQLRRLGVGRESRVGLSTERSPAMVAAVLGILKAGGAYLPLDASYPRERLAMLLADAAPAAVVGSRRLLDALPGSTPRLELEWLATAEEPEEPAAAEPGVGDVTPDGLAYVMYTSGSTGAPKGVAVPHQAVVRLVRESGFMPFGPDEVFLQLAPMSFDAATLELWGPLLNGGRLALFPPRPFSLSELTAAVQRFGVTTLWLTAGLFHLAVEEGIEGLSGLRRLIAGGDALSPGLVGHALAALPRTALLNGYGPTENTTFSTTHPLRGSLAAGDSAPIGRPIGGSQAYVLDAALELAPLGCPGELFVGGAGLARGYLGRPDLTAERFVPSPFSEPSGVSGLAGQAGGARLYRTGDLVRLRPDGVLEFLGRRDFQVKVRGFRIELAEVESAVLRCPGVSAAVVVALADGARDHRLAAYYVAAKGEAVSEAELRDSLRANLPAHMLPSSYTALPALPLTQNGKVDRRALPAPDMPMAAASGEEGAGATPRTPAEEIVAGIWQEILTPGGGRRIGVHENFFALGGHSLLATRAVSRLRQAFGVEVPLRLMFEAPTLGDLARRITLTLQGDAAVQLPPLRPRGQAGDLLPLSFPQQRLWFLDRLSPDSAAYNIPAAYELRGPLSPAALAAALSEIVRRHEALRTRFVEVEGEPWQRIGAAAPVPLPLFDLRAVSAAAAALAHLRDEEARRPFALAHGPLLRASLVRLGAEHHVLLLTLHHIVSDGWSDQVLRDELAALYAAAAVGRPSPLRPLPVQYADFALWQRAWPEAVLGGQLDYWRQQLRGAPAALELPTDRPRPAVQSFRGASREQPLPADLAARLRQAARREGATLYMTLLAAFAALLARYSGQDDLLIGSPVANRTLPEVEGLIGFFVNTLVLRARVGGNPTLRAILAAVRETALGAFSHQDLPFEALVEELRPERDLARNPLIQVLLALQTAGGAADAALATDAALHFCPLATSDSTTAKFDLSLVVDEAAEGAAMVLALEYAADLFGATTAARLLGHYSVLLAAAVETPWIPLSQLPLLSPAERHQALVEWNDTAANGLPAAAGSGAWVHELVAAQARRRPAAPAVVAEGQVLTYGELDRRAGLLARALRRLGARPEVLVGVCLERSPDLVVSVLAVLRAGAAYVALDPAHPEERLAFQLRHSRVPVLLTRRGHLADIAAAQGIHCLFPDGMADQGSEAVFTLPAGELLPANLAYVIYTSGSTGKPKGVELTHASLLNLVDWHRRAFGITEDDRASLLAGVGFDASVWETWPYLVSGASLHIPPTAVRASATALRQWLCERDISVSFQPPALAEGLLDLDWSDGEPGGAAPPSALRFLLTGGDRLQRYPKASLPFVVVNDYGPTEGTVVATSGVVPAGERPGRLGLPPSLGRPIDNVQVHVVDRRGGESPAPAGVPGELLVGGAGLARGYLGRADLTADSFIPDAFVGEAAAGARLYRTGDLVRWRQDGELEFLGRIDTQVKIRGYRIELGEIEATLAGHPEVRDVAVLAVLGAEDSLVAFYTARRQPAPGAAELREHLRRQLPDYMLPASFVPLAAMPLNASGKVDRRALAALGSQHLPAADAAAGEVAAPRTPVEELIASVWEEVLGLSPIQAADNFFHLGGHSLLVTRVLSRMREALGVELPVQALFEHPTVGALARLVTAARQDAGAPSLPPLRPAPRPAGGRLPLSFPQQRLWFLDRLAPDSSTYNMTSGFALDGPLSPAALAASLGEIVRRHESLRTLFVEVDGEPWQEIQPAGGFRLPCVDLSALPSGTGEPTAAGEPAAAGVPTAAAGSRQAAELARLCRDEAHRPFVLSRGPLLRAMLFRLSPEAGADRHVLLLNVHHIVSDGWSNGVLLAELSALYCALTPMAASPASPASVASPVAPTPLAELPIQYADFAAWQRAWPPAVLAGQLAYWRRRLGGTATLEVPTDRPRPPMQTFRGGFEPLALSPQLAASLRALARGRRVTHFMTLLASWQALFHRLTGQRDIAIGTPVANRSRPELEGLIGFFVNMLALRVDCAGAPSYAELLGRLRQVALEAYDHADLPFERLVDELDLGRDLSRQPLVQVMFALESAAPAPDLAGLALRPVDLGAAVAKFDLTLFLVDGGGEIDGGIEYSTDLFDRATAVRLAGHWRNLLAAMAADPEAPIASLDPLAAAERHQVLREWNDTAAPYPASTLLHDFFAAAAARQPAALAAVCAGQELTYGDLAARAYRLGHLLRGCGLPRGAAVGVWMERSLDMLVAVLGILEAGGHYLPLDASWPAVRVEAILAATGARAVIAGAAMLAAVEEMRWRLPKLGDAVCLAVPTPAPPVETIDPDSVRGLWDFVAERAVDRVTAGGFVSALTGKPFAEAEVDEYRDRVLGLAAPWLRPGARVLEIGNGSGLLLWEIAPRVAHAVGIDPSPLTQGRNAERRDALGLAAGRVELLTGFAHEIDALLPPGERFDLVLLASTVQFFPGPRYAESVLAAALRRLAPGGAVLIADVLDPRRRGELDAAIAAGRAARAADAADHREEPTQRRELFLDEDYFRDLAALPGAGAVAVHHRETGFANDLGFRYDVLISGAPLPPPTEAPALSPRRRKRLWTGWHAAAQTAARLAPVATPDDVAYVIHTSGSTGEPKGIVVQHRPVANLIDWINRSFAVTPADRVLFVTSLSFDLSVYDVFGVLAAGGSVHVATDEELGDPDRLTALLRTGGITVWDSAPAALVRLAPLFPAAPDAASRLRLVMLSGDWIPVTLPDRVRRAFPAARVMALGGATEATIWSNWFPVGDVDPAWPSIPYGRPMSNARYHVLDAGLAPCPVGVPGDLYIGGDCLCCGYAGRPDLTAPAFVPDPFATRPGMRLYRTGDRVRAFTDGNLEFLGRRDQQVKVRGYRIELGEIEVALSRHPGLRDAVVLARPVRPDTPTDLRLVAYAVPAAEGQAAPTAAQLRELLRQALPEYMVPAAFVFLPALPVTANGKLDRAALPAPGREDVATDDAAAGAAATAAAPPRDALETSLAGLWSEVLGVGAIGIHDNFFQLGGHSLLATQLVARIRQSAGIEVPLRLLFQRPTVADLASALREAVADEGSPIRAIARHGELPLSYSQLRQWFLVQLEPRASAYNLPLVLRLRGTLQEAALAASLEAMVRRHESLRTTFAAVDGLPRAVIADTLRLPLARLDLSALDTDRRQAEIGRLAQSEGERVFDLERGPLFQILLLRVAPDEHLLLLTIHHIVFDGWSLAVFTRELAALYAALSAEGTPEGDFAPPRSVLPDLAIQYVDYAAWQRRWLAGDGAREQIEYWRRQLAGAAKMLHLPTDRPRPAVQTYRGSAEPLHVAEPLARALRALGLGQGATLFMTLLAGFGALLQRYTRQDDVNVGTYVANRRWQELEPLMGFFVNTLVLRARLSGEPDFHALVGRVRDTTLGAYEHQDLPFEKLLEALDTERDLSRTPLFQVMFGLQNFAASTIDTPGLQIASADLYEGVRANFDLGLWIWEDGAALSGWLHYNVDLFDRATVRRLLRHLTALLEAVVAEPGRRLLDVPLLSAAEAHQALHEWRGSRSAGGDAAPSAPTAYELVRAQAALTPWASAVEHGPHVLTYAELEGRAAALAGCLRALGVGREMVIGLCCPRSPELVVGMLGILAAGAAYLPLDPTLPADRLIYLTADAGAAALLVGGAPPSGLLAGFEGPVLHLDDAAALDALPALDEPGEPVEPHDLAYVLYTSGSTGRPKGVQVEQGALARFIAASVSGYGLHPGDRVLQFANPSFDTSVEEIFPCFAAGATLVLRDEAMMGSPAHFFTACAEWEITVLDLPTAYWHTLVGAVADAAAPSGPADPSDRTDRADRNLLLPPALRLVILGGERAQPERVLAWLAAVGTFPVLVNTYGPTEATVVATAGVLRLPATDAAAGPGEVVTADVAPIGRPWGAARVWLLDDGLRPVPLGVAAELHIGGGGLARGYLGRPELTAERFVPNPYAAGAGAGGERLYRTGDLARFRTDGCLEFVGRVDDQVKVRGFRVEPGEIANVLAGHPAVREAAVVARAVDGGDWRLVAYVVPSADGEPADGELREYLKAHLPAYMVPSDFVLLPALPLTATGKLDRAALPQPAAGPEAGYTPPETATEEQLVQIWEEVLRRSPVGIHDNLFDLGGHSLLLPQLVSRIERVFQLELPVRVLFEAPTVAQLAALVETAILAQIEELSDEEAAALMDGLDEPSIAGISMPEHA